jgi:hypothetical protein
MKRSATERPTLTVLDSLGAAEQAALLEELPATHPDLAAETNGGRLPCWRQRRAAAPPPWSWMRCGRWNWRT